MNIEYPCAASYHFQTCVLVSHSPILIPQCRPKARVASRLRESSLKRNCKKIPSCSSSHAYIRYREAVKASEKRQVEFKDWVVASKEFSKDEKAALNVDSVAAFEDFWQNTNTAKADFDRGKERGCGLCVKRYQSSAAFISPFMKDFSPIVQIVRDFGAPYGAVAVGTMSLQFAVSVDFSYVESLVPPTDTMRRWQRTKIRLRKV